MAGSKFCLPIAEWPLPFSLRPSSEFGFGHMQELPVCYCKKPSMMCSIVHIGPVDSRETGSILVRSGF